jgi:myo-inositol-1(or 4)-monophosphatase
MRFSANLNIIIKAIEKASNHISRDFVELENLQSNPASAAKFTSASYNRVKQVLIEDFAKFRPEFNIVFSDGQKVSNQEDAEYSLIIHVVDGIENLLRASTDFTVSIALIYRNSNGQSEAISVAISKIIGGELYYSEKGFGAYLNNRRIRVSKRINKAEMLTVCDDIKLAETLKIMPRNLGCKTLEIANLASAKIEHIIYKKSNFEFFQPFFLLLKEAGGKVVEDEDKYVLSNN